MSDMIERVARAIENALSLGLTAKGRKIVARAAIDAMADGMDEVFNAMLASPALSLLEKYRAEIIRAELRDAMGLDPDNPNAGTAAERQE